MLACKLLGHQIWRVTGADILPCSNHTQNLNEQQRVDELRFIKLLQGFLASEWLFYSPTFDLTRNIQSQALPKQRNGFLGADTRFVVNRFIAEPFLKIVESRTDTRLEDFMIFCIEGCKSRNSKVCADPF
jgi:hypothetical protein